MPYLAKNHKSNNSNKIQTGYANNRNNKMYNNQGYQNSNFEKQVNNGKLKEKINNIKAKQKKEQAKKAISKAVGTVNPIAGFATDKMLETKRGQKVLDAYAKADSPSEGIANAKREINKQKRQIKFIGLLVVISLPLILVVFFLSIFAKNADSQIYSNENGGTLESDDYHYDDKETNIFANYPGLYEKIIDVVKRVSDQYKVEIDKYLIIATLISPIENGLIVPVDDNSCGETDCYYFKGESKTWTEFLSSWGDQSELLAKMQVLTYINNENEIKVECGQDETMEQYAQNDLETNTFPWYGWLNPVNWFRGFRDAAGAEVNAKCVTAKNGNSKVPTVRVLSIDQGDYYVSTINNGEYEYEKDPNSGGVYFWNLINKNGFIHEYLKDYLSDAYSEDSDKNYEVNKKTIVETVNYIYSYYESIRKDCNGFPVIKGELDKVKFREDKDSPIYTLDFEDIFVGGSLLATYGGATGEVAYAQAIITRSEAYSYIVEEGADVIVGTAKMGCWWWKYNPTYDPSYEDQKDNPNYDPDYPKKNFPEIYKAVTETRGIVVTEYNSDIVMDTEYDAFCPTTSNPINGFYYLPEGQRSLPIDNSYLNNDSRNRAKCPCFKNSSSRPDVSYASSLDELLRKTVGDPPQTTSQACWTSTGGAGTDENGNSKIGYKYSATGGHGFGVSQHGMAYFAKFGYDRYSLIKLFLERDNRGISFKKYEGSIEEGECTNYDYFKKESSSGGNYDGEYSGNSNYNNVIGGTPLNTDLASALAKNGHTIDDLNNCIKQRVNQAGFGTREGVVESGMSLIQCTMDLTGGYTYPYDHYGGSISSANPDIAGKLGVNSRWGKLGGTGCAAEPCRLGLNCATFVRWAMCNGGMDFCDKGSTFAHEMFKLIFSRGGINVKLTPNFQVLPENSSISSNSQAFDNIKPGDVLYSDNLSGGANHVMLIVGVESDSITIAENGRKTRKISKNELINSSTKTYSVLLLDDFYANSSNKNGLS